MPGLLFSSPLSFLAEPHSARSWGFNKMWMETDREIVPASKLGPSEILLMRLVDENENVCFTATQFDTEDKLWRAIVIDADQMKHIRRFFAGLKR